MHPGLDLVLGDLGDQRVDPAQHPRHNIGNLIEGRTQRRSRGGNAPLAHPDGQFQQQRQRRGGRLGRPTDTGRLDLERCVGLGLQRRAGRVGQGNGIRSAMLSQQERFDGPRGLAGTGQGDNRRAGVDEVRVVVRELQALHGFTGHPERALERLPRSDHDGQRVPAADQHDTADAGGEPVGNLVQSGRIELQCCLYRRRLAKEFRSGSFDARVQFRVQRIIAGQGEDVGTLSVGDPLYDGALADIERAGTRIEKGAGGSAHCRVDTAFVHRPWCEAPSPGVGQTVYRFRFFRITFRHAPVKGIPSVDFWRPTVLKCQTHV